jgi:HD-GYP domain-containing protein (c-di-GMP phosphodiesterase class II)
MRAIPTKYVTESSVLGENLYTAEGKILVKRGTLLTPSLINKIESNQIFTVYIDDAHSDFEVNRLLEQSFRVQGALLIKKLFETARRGESIFSVHHELIEFAEDVLYEIRSYKKIQIEYIDIKNVKNYIYSSALNVALISALISWELGYGSDLVKQIFLGAIYHDIGIAFIPPRVINKTTPLTLEEKKMILMHPKKGHDFLKDQAFISAYVKAIVLQHHEHIDGTGYPTRYSGDDVNKIAQIIGIADIYDAMTSDRPYRRAVSPHEAIEYIVAIKGKIFYKDVADAFIGRISPYPRGTIVRLSDKRHAVVDEINDKWPLRPIIRVIHKTDTGYEYEMIELLKRQNLLIEDVVYDHI